MSAIEYGSYYWGVVLHGSGPQGIGQMVHLHADQMKVDSNGALIFLSAGRRPAGSNPNAQEQQNGKDGDKKSSDEKSGKSQKDEKEHKKDEGSGNNDMIYFAFGPGTWKAVYAAKLTDGLPASVEHWTSFDGKRQLPEMVGVNAGAAGQPS